MKTPQPIEIDGLVGRSADRVVFLGFAEACLLHRISVADVLNEETAQGYQRRFDKRHSQDFRRYIQSPGATTIPLTFNLRPRPDGGWRVTQLPGGRAVLRINAGCQDALFQVDCQHRLGFLADQQLVLPFMAFIGLTHEEEMAVFSTINGKAKGLGTSLLDYHEAQLAQDLERDRPELYVALRLHEDERSPWFRQLDLGGHSTTGLKRRASLRTMQKAVKKFLSHSDSLGDLTAVQIYELLLGFWRAVAFILEQEWSNPRKHFLTKGVGVYALSILAADIYCEARPKSLAACTENYMRAKLVDFLPTFDWSTSGPLRGLGGEAGVREAVHMLRTLRNSTPWRVFAGGK